MLSDNRKFYITASNAHRIMGDFEKELSAGGVERPDLPDDAFIYMQNLKTKPKVGEAKKAGISLTGAEINALWSYIKAQEVVITQGMRTMAIELAMSEFRISKEGVSTGAIERGIRLEADAMDALQRRIGIVFDNRDENQVFLHNGLLGVTPDGIEYAEAFDIKSCAETKAPAWSTHEKYLFKVNSADDLLKVEPKYYWQAQCGLAVTGAEIYHWASYNPNYEEPFNLLYIGILPNGKHIELMKSRADRVFTLADTYKAEIKEKFKGLL